MALLGTAALAMWWDVAAEARAELEHWHAHEHVPERLSLPGFLRASRWTAVDGGEGFFVMYELQDHAVLSSPAYVARLNAPTPWSTRMMPLHRHMVRTQNRVVVSRGAVTARHVLTVRFSPTEPAPATATLARDLDDLARDLSAQPGIVGVHVLRHDAPALAVTTEQRIRGLADQAADGTLVVSGYDLAALQALASGPLDEARWLARGAVPRTPCQCYALAYSATPGDVR